MLIVVSSVATCSYGVNPSELAVGYGDPVPTSVDEAKSFLSRGAEALSGLQNDNVLAVTITDSEATSVLSLGMLIPELTLAMERLSPEEIAASRDLEALRERVRRENDAVRREMMQRASLSQRLAMMLDPRIRTGEVQVKFNASGEVVVSGYVQAWSFRQAGVFVVAPAVRDSELQLDFVEGQLGRLPLPEFAFDLFGRLLSSTILLGREYAEISEISVEEGRLRLVGRLGA